MKRSHVVSLVLLGAAGVAAYALSSSNPLPEDTAEASVFKGLDDCLVRRDVDPALCRAGFEQAQRAHAQAAPRFEAKEDCEKQFGSGQCNGSLMPNNSGGFSTYFLPALAGYAIARSVQGPGAQPAAQPLYGCPPERQRPDGTCYTTRTGSSFWASTGRSSSSGLSWFGRGSSSGEAASAATATAVTSRAQVPSAGFARTTTTTRPPVVSRGSSLSRSVGTVSRGGFGATGRSLSVRSSST